MRTYRFFCACMSGKKIQAKIQAQKRYKLKIQAQKRYKLKKDTS